MRQTVDAFSAGVSALALVDKLVKTLREKGILTEEEARAIATEAINDIESSPDPTVKKVGVFLRLWLTER